MGTKMLTRPSLRKPNSFCYKVFKKEVLQQIRLKSRRFGFEPEITVKLAKLKCRIYEVPISYSGRLYEEGKKIGWKDGVAALFYLIRYKFFNQRSASFAWGQTYTIDKLALSGEPRKKVSIV